MSVENLQTVSEKGWRISRQSRWESLLSMGEAGLNGQSHDGKACWGRLGRGDRAAADLRCHRAFDLNVIGRLFRGGPMELNQVTHPLSHKIVYRFGEIQGGRPGLTRAGTAACTDDQKRGGRPRQTSPDVRLAEDKGKRH